MHEKTKERVKRITYLYVEKIMFLNEIANEIGITLQAVRMHLISNNVKMRSIKEISFLRTIPLFERKKALEIIKKTSKEKLCFVALAVNKYNQSDIYKKRKSLNKLNWFVVVKSYSFPKYCKICGKKLSIKRGYTKGETNCNLATLDRIDNTKAHILKNTRGWVCLNCNLFFGRFYNGLLSTKRFTKIEINKITKNFVLDIQKNSFKEVLK